jgi:4'-phosphopantetheinyl transferase
LPNTQLTKPTVWGLNTGQIAPQFNQILNDIGPELSAKVDLYQKTEDKWRVAGGHWLTQKWINTYYPNININEQKRHQYGKPFFQNLPEFNISHSGDWVVFAFAKQGKIGVDIEKIRTLEIQNFNKQFSPTDLVKIQQNKNPLRAFFNAWTIKEAVMKADGRAMKIPLHHIHLAEAKAYIQNEPNPWFTCPFFADPEHMGTVSMNIPFATPDFLEINLL